MQTGNAKHSSRVVQTGLNVDTVGYLSTDTAMQTGIFAPIFNRKS